MEFQKFNGPQDVINKINELTGILGVMGKITGNPQLQFLTQMILCSLVASQNKDHMVKLSKMILDFIEQLEIAEGKVSAVESLKKKEICMN
jgi:hypothetical protein